MRMLNVLCYEACHLEQNIWQSVSHTHTYIYYSRLIAHPTVWNNSTMISLEFCYSTMRHIHTYIHMRMFKQPSKWASESVGRVTAIVGMRFAKTLRIAGDTRLGNFFCQPVRPKTLKKIQTHTHTPARANIISRVYGFYTVENCGISTALLYRPVTCSEPENGSNTHPHPWQKSAHTHPCRVTDIATEVNRKF